MAGYSASTCDILTLFPMGVSCSTIDAYTPFTNDGYATLIITGGTFPYTTTWSNGAQTSFISGVQAGLYTATTIDYYGDFTAVTVCDVGYQTYGVEKFYNCNDTNNIIFYRADYDNQVLTGKTYVLVGQNGCWVSEGLEIYTGGTLYENFVQILSGPFVNCTQCLPTTPAIENTNKLCLTTSSIVIVPGFPPTFTQQYNQFQFYSANTINGYPSWTSNTLTMYYNSSASKWLISGWTYDGLPNLVSTLSPPIGTWANSGINGSANVVQGDCTTNFIINTNQTNPTCINSVNGAIIVTSVIGGNPPYTYALNNPSPGNYQPGSIFNNLDDGTYTIYAKDIIGNVGSKVITLTPQQSITNYQVNLSFIPSTPTDTIFANGREISFQYQITCTPPLASNKSVNLSFLHTTTISAGTASNTSPTLTYTNTTGTTTGGSYLTNTQNTITNSYPNTISCHPNYYTTATTRQYTVQLSGSGVVNGSIFKKVIANTGINCGPFGTIIDTFTITNISLSNQTVCETISTTSPTISNTLSFGAQAQLSSSGPIQTG